MIAPATTRGAWLVQGEVDAGAQRRCRECGEWWPLEPTNWLVRGERLRRRPGLRSRHYLQPCRACRRDLGLPYAS